MTLVYYTNGTAMTVYRYCDECQRTQAECDEAHDNCIGRHEREYERDQYRAYLDGEV